MRAAPSAIRIALRHRPLILEIVIELVTVEQGDLARQSFLDSGKGRHKAELNFGDCFSYALAKVTAEPLLFKGNDFHQTDVLTA
jgi:ribonuclease VapC